MLLTAPIKVAVANIKGELKKAMASDAVTYQAGPLMKLLTTVMDMIERQGIPLLDSPPVNSSTEFTSDYINKLASSMNRILVIISQTIDELTTQTNSALVEYTNKFNAIQPQLSDLEQRIDDIVAQTQSKMMANAVYTEEIKNINFSRNMAITSLAVYNNVLLLPIINISRPQIKNNSFVIAGSRDAMNKLSDSFAADYTKTDADLIVGTYFGNIVGMLDGTEAFKSIESIDPNVIYNDNINEVLTVNYYTDNPNDYLKVEVTTEILGRAEINFIGVTSDVDTSVMHVLSGEKTRLMTRNGVWISSLMTDALTAIFEQRSAVPLRYQGIDVLDKESNVAIKRHNYFNSLGYLYPEILKSLNSGITTSPISTTNKQEIKIVERQGFFKYKMDIEKIDFRLNEYGSTGQITSEIIVTDSPIVSVSMIADQYIPDDAIEYIQYEISFDNNTWYQVRPENEGVTKFNMDRKSRIVLNNDNNNPDYMFIGSQTPRFGVYLRVTLNGVTRYVTPAVYNLQLVVKVKDNA